MNTTTQIEVPIAREAKILGKISILFTSNINLKYNHLQEFIGRTPEKDLN